jgi:hypothetical protein
MEGKTTNGLVTDIQKIDEYKKLEEDILYHNYDDYSLKGIIEDSDLSNAFLSPENTQNIQNDIRYGVFQSTNKVISKQSKEEVFTIMRSIYLQNGGTRVFSENDFIGAIQKLNKKVTDYSVENIVSKLRQHEMYIEDISTLPVPLERPKYENGNSTTYRFDNLM